MPRSRQHSGFTLVELLVSIAIALLLIVGVNAVFKVTSQTVGAGNALLSAYRDGRTVFQTFFVDASNVDAVPAAGSTSGDGPFFIIRSEHVYAFRNAADKQVATSPNDPSTDTNLFPGFPANQAPVPFIHYRSHRIDRLGFFSRNVFPRQTTSDGNSFVATGPGVGTGNEAFVYYGHADQPVNAGLSSGGTWPDPGYGTFANNANNYYASDWMLARMAMILLPTATGSHTYADNGGLSPLNFGPTAAPWTSTSQVATIDDAATSIANYGSVLRPNGIQSYSYHLSALNGPGPNYGGDWWDPLITYRYRSSPFVLAGSSVPKITPATLAQCAPDLIRGCSQFIVEYAGNFYTKAASVPVTSSNPYGLPDGTPAASLPNGTPQTVPTPDPSGEVDFFRDSNGNAHTRWYGYPRSTGGTANTVSASSGDVVPLRDVLAYLNSAWATGAKSTTGSYADAERFSTNFPSATPGATPTNYWTALSGNTDKLSRYTYAAAWGPDVQYQSFPKMIRIIIEIDDHEGRMNVPQRYEFIYDVQQ